MYYMTDDDKLSIFYRPSDVTGLLLLYCQIVKQVKWICKKKRFILWQICNHHALQFKFPYTGLHFFDLNKIIIEESSLVNV